MKQVLVHPGCNTPVVADRPSTKPKFLSMSELLTATVADARALDPRIYQPNFAILHSADTDAHCQVCLAGSMIARTPRCSPNETFFPGEFDDDTNNQLKCLDYIRRGHWVLAFYEFHRYWPRSPIENRLRQLPKPDNINFKCWSTYRAHLDSLDAILPELREIEIEQHWR